MPEAIRETLIVGARARFEAMRVASGYSQNVLGVERDNYDMGENPPRPSVWMFEGDEEKDPVNPDMVGAVKCTLPVLVTYVADAAGGVVPTIQTRMLADLTKAMGVDIDVVDAAGAGQTVEVREIGTGTEYTKDNGLVWAQTLFHLIYHHAVGDQTLMCVF